MRDLRNIYIVFPYKGRSGKAVIRTKNAFFVVLHCS